MTASSREADVRKVFVIYLAFIFGGLAYMWTIGVLHR